MSSHQQAGPLIAIVAGEASGDVLGAALIQALKKRLPNARFFGVAGPLMEAAGCETLERIDVLSVMGISEVLRHLPRLFKLRAQLLRQIVARKPDLMIGIDAPDFNLSLEQRVRARGVRTIHYVSPTVWAWREGRVKHVAAAADRVLALFPFEAPFYQQHDVPVDFVGHPLADQLAPGDRSAAREQLGLPLDREVVAFLPGSRAGEVVPLMQRFAAAAGWLQARRPELQFVVPVAKASLLPLIEAAIADQPRPAQWTLIDGQAQQAMTAADLVVLASGTATLECLLLGRPMVVTYTVSPFTHFLLRGIGMLKVRHVSLPNLLCPEPLVPELLQSEAAPENLGAQVFRYLEQAHLRHEQCAAFDLAREQLRCNAAERAADAVIAELQSAGD